MNLNRRNLLKQLGAGIAASSVIAPQHASAVDIRESAPDLKVSALHREPIRLDRNENAYGASQKAITAMQEAAKGSSQYPDSSVLQKTLAVHHNDATSRAHHGIEPEQIVVGCGSS